MTIMRKMKTAVKKTILVTVMRTKVTDGDNNDSDEDKSDSDDKSNDTRQL